MPLVGNLYDSGPISPIVKIDENLTIWTENTWQDYKVNYIEGIPRSRPFSTDIVALNNAANIPAYTALNAQFVLSIQPAANPNSKYAEMLHLRWEPLDDVEGQLFELQPGRYNPRGGQATVSMFTHVRDPYLASTTFFVLGQSKDARIGAYNPNPVALLRALFVFWGYRYVLEPLANHPGVTTKVPAQAFAF